LRRRTFTLHGGGVLRRGSIYHRENSQDHLLSTSGRYTVTENSAVETALMETTVEVLGIAAQVQQKPPECVYKRSQAIWNFALSNPGWQGLASD